MSERVTYQLGLVPAFVSFESISLDAANERLERWGHRMGPLTRPMNDDVAHALLHEGEPVAVVTTSSLLRERAGGGLGHLTRANAVELSRLCADRPSLCRVALRLWREFVLPPLRAAISYQDAELHSGATYRTDGWARSPEISRSGVDQRSGRQGRRKWIWVWPREAVVEWWSPVPQPREELRPPTGEEEGAANG